MNSTFFDLYKGKGKKLKERERELPPYSRAKGLDDPGLYMASEGLRDAVNVALALGQPLLVTGDPGTGKTCLAASIAWELGLDLLEFHTKTTSAADDLLYHYDALRRFHDAQAGDTRHMEDYITGQALGAAILMANPTERGQKLLPAELRNTDARRSVVLIDEIDKAPRDLPNDVLNEIEKMRFRIRETDWPPFSAETGMRPVVVLTSNSEKNLPEAFLRRCVFYHITFPDPDTLKQIVRNRFSDGDLNFGITADDVDEAVTHFMGIRDLKLKRKPATGELLPWLSVVKSLGVGFKEMTEADRKKLAMSYSVLAKNKDDLKRMKSGIGITESR